MLSMPAALASSTPYWMIGLSTSGSISLGCAFVAGRNRVPRPAAGKTALRIVAGADRLDIGGSGGAKKVAGGRRQGRAIIPAFDTLRKAALDSPLSTSGSP